MRLLILLMLSVLAGCASDLKAPTTDNYRDVPVLRQVKIDPVVETFPRARVIESAEGIEYMAFNAGEGDQILAYRNASKANREALTHLVAAHNDVIAERNILVSTLKLEEARKNAMAEAYAEAESGRRQEQQTRIIETTIYKALLVIIGLSAL